MESIIISEGISVQEMVDNALQQVPNDNGLYLHCYYY